DSFARDGNAEFRERGSRNRVRRRDERRVELEQLRPSHTVENLHVEDLAHVALESKKSDDGAAAQIDDVDAALPLGNTLRQWNAAEDVRLANLRESHECERSREREAARESGKLRDRFHASAAKIGRRNRSFPRLEDEK